MDAIDEIVAEFLVESLENLDRLDRDLLALEQEPASRELLASIFRTIHTIKGTSGFLAFDKLQALTHVGESLLSRLRDGRIELTEDRASSLLGMVDAIRGLLTTIEQTGTEGDNDHSELVQRLFQLLEDSPSTTQPELPEHALERADAGQNRVDDGPADVAAEPEMPDEHPARSNRRSRSRATGAKATRAAFDRAEAEGRVGASAATMVAGQAEQTPSAVRSADLLPEPAAGPRSGGPLADEQGAKGAPAGPVEPGPTGGSAQAAADSQDARRSVVDSSVRVDVELLDTLMRMVGELVLARNQLISELEIGRESARDGSVLARSAQRLSLVTSDLQEQVMKTRMQPVDSVCGKLPRLVRDLARQCGRQVRLEMEGRDTELDRSVLEAIKDPLTHLVRNAVDHGIEPPEARVAAGKPAEGLLRLRAYHEAGQVHLEIIDDGAGIHPDRLAAKALERGLVSQAQLAAMTDRDRYNLIFLPGFSTRDEVTNVSGRGVGMDVVKTRIEQIGGSVDVSSQLGSGSTFRLTIPLTLAIIPALTIGCGGHRYALPQVSVLELVRLSGEHARGGVELIAGAPVYRLRGSLLPLVRLDQQMGLLPEGEQEELGTDGERGGYIVVLQAEQQRFGLVVHEVLDTQEIVVKPLGRHLKGIPLYAGATILGDGSVVLILDATTLARQSNVLANATGAPAAAQAEESAPIDPVLVVELGGNRRAAIPLDMVTRLEEIPATSIERVGGREVVQYRGQIMPLARLSTLLGGNGDSADAERVQLVVHGNGERSVGFVVDRILDIATERAGTRSHVDDHALIGSVVVGDRVVELLDVRAAVLAADPAFFLTTPRPVPALPRQAGVPDLEELPA